MKSNMGNTDRIVRALIAIGILSLYLGEVITGTIAIILLILAGIFVVTSLISFCPLYKPFGITTCKKQ